MQMDLVAERLASEVRAAMARQRMNQSALAEALGVSQAAVSRRLAGVVPFDVNELVIVADFLGVSALDLLAPALPGDEVAVAG